MPSFLLRLVIFPFKRNTPPPLPPFFCMARVCLGLLSLRDEEQGTDGRTAAVNSHSPLPRSADLNGRRRFPDKISFLSWTCRHHHRRRDPKAGAPPTPCPTNESRTLGPFRCCCIGPPVSAPIHAHVSNAGRTNRLHHPSLPLFRRNWTGRRRCGIRQRLRRRLVWIAMECGSRFFSFGETKEVRFSVFQRVFFKGGSIMVELDSCSRFGTVVRFGCLVALAPALRE